MALAYYRRMWPVLLVTLFVAVMAIQEINSLPNTLGLSKPGPYIGIMLMAAATSSVIFAQERRIAALERALNKPPE